MYTALNRAIARLKLLTATTLMATPAVSAGTPQSLKESRTLLRDVRELAVQQTATAESAHAEMKAVERRVDEAFAKINALAGVDQCWEHGVVYLAGDESGSTGQLPHSVELYIIGPFGKAFAGFSSGTTLSAVLAGINALWGYTGALAEIAPDNPNRVAVKSGMYGSVGFVTVQQLTGTNPILFAQATGGIAMYEWTDCGCTFGVPVCGDAAEVYLSTGEAVLENHQLGSITLFVQGLAGSQQFTFASGTTQPNIISAFETFKYYLGVQADQSPDNPARVRLRSTTLSDESLVQVQQVGGSPPIIFSEAIGGVAAYDVTDLGVDAVTGDVNCDRWVDALDLDIVILDWGQCPAGFQSCASDVTGDGVVNVDDLLLVIKHWSGPPGK